MYLQNRSTTWELATDVTLQEYPDLLQPTQGSTQASRSSKPLEGGATISFVFFVVVVFVVVLAVVALITVPSGKWCPAPLGPLGCWSLSLSPELRICMGQ